MYIVNKIMYIRFHCDQAHIFDVYPNAMPSHGTECIFLHGVLGKPCMCHINSSFQIQLFHKKLSRCIGAYPDRKEL